MIVCNIVSACVIFVLCDVYLDTFVLGVVEFGVRVVVVVIKSGFIGVIGI